MQIEIRVIFTSLVVLSLISCAANRSAERGNQAVQQNVEAYQRALIARGVTGGSVAGVFRGRDTVAYSIVNSGLAGDTPISANTIFPIWSMSKPITVVAMMILHEKGLYELSDPVSKYIPYFSNLQCKDKTGQIYRCKNELKIVDLLSHRSGYGYYDRGKGPSTLDHYENLDQFVRDVAAYPVAFEPGTDYLYGINMAILGRVVEVVSGKEFFEFLKESIFEPLDMANTKFELYPDDRKHFQVLFKKPKPLEEGARFDEGTSTFSTADDELSYSPGTKAQFGGEGLVSTFEDYRHFCEMLIQKGNYRGRRILDERSLRMMTSVATEGRLMRGYNNGQDYGYSLFILTEPVLDGTASSKGIFGWSGAHNTHFWIDYEKSIYGLFMTRTVPFSWEIQKQLRSAVYRALN
jgi:CubicO group peptidase (beta-lactamase class C family)